VVRERKKKPKGSKVQKNGGTGISTSRKAFIGLPVH
jgi:hypothetical protein